MSSEIQNKTRFSEEDIEFLITLWNDGVKVKDIALSMGRSFHNIRNKVKALHKSGRIKQRDMSNNIKNEELEDLSARFNLPIDTVRSISKLFSGGRDNILSSTETACEAYKAQNGYCYYLSDRVKLSFSGEPSDAVPMNGHNNSMVLVCKAVAHTRNTLGHSAFVNVCSYIANKFNNK